MKRNTVADILKDKFGAEDVNPGKMSVFETYLPTWTRVVFRFRPEDGPDSEYYRMEISKFSRFLANSNLIDYQDENGRRVKRHLTHGEYERVSAAREQAGTGRLLPYESVKASYTTGGFDDGRMQEALELVSQGVVEF